MHTFEEKIWLYDVNKHWFSNETKQAVGKEEFLINATCHYSVFHSVLSTNSFTS